MILLSIAIGGALAWAVWSISTWAAEERRVRAYVRKNLKTERREKDADA